MGTATCDNVNGETRGHDQQVDGRRPNDSGNDATFDQPIENPCMQKGMHASPNRHKGDGRELDDNWCQEGGETDNHFDADDIKQSKCALLTE